MKSYIIRREFLVWEEAEIFADSEDEAVEVAETRWKDLSPESLNHLEPTGMIEIILPEDG
jgi:hypothetical protein